MTEPRRRLAAIMFTDMVGYSALTQEDEAGALALLDRHNQVLRPVFAKFGGREIKTVGDAFLVEFESALDATQCAIEIQQKLLEHNLQLPEPGKIRIRIAIHVGDVVESGGDVLGDAVNIASRINALAEPGGICLTQQAYDQIQNKVAASFTRLPPASLKNIRTPIPVYRVAPPWEPTTVSAMSPDRDRGPSLAVLPLANISPDPGDAYFADGLTEELISVLSQVPGLSVIARTSVAPYKTNPKSAAQVGSELGVDSVLEGSVRKAGSRIRITLQLVDASSQRHIWASTFNREIGDVFTVQTEIANQTAEALRLEFSRKPAPSSGSRPTPDPAAYEVYLRGLVASRLPEGKGIDEAALCFEQATRLDPNFAEAFAAWANLYVAAAGSFLSLPKIMKQTRELAARALRLDPGSSEVHSTFGNILLQFDHDWRRAEEEFGTAISLNPNNVQALSYLSYLLIARGRANEARDVLRRAIRLDPAGNHQRPLAWAELEAGNFDTAIRLGEQERDRHPESSHAHSFLGIFYLVAGRRAEATREAGVPLTGANEEARFDHALLNALLGRPEEARLILQEEERGEPKQYNSGTDLAMLYATTGATERALDLLEKDSQDGDQTLWLFYRGIFFDSLRTDPRFVALLRKFDLPTQPPLRGPPSGDPH